MNRMKELTGPELDRVSGGLSQILPIPRPVPWPPCPWPPRLPRLPEPIPVPFPRPPFEIM